jgi:hypothetical protein
MIDVLLKGSEISKPYARSGQDPYPELNAIQMKWMHCSESVIGQDSTALYSTGQKAGMAVMRSTG